MTAQLLAKITPVFLASLTVNSTFQTEGLLQGVTQEPLVWRFKSSSAHAGQYLFEVSYFGIVLGDFAVFVEGVKVSVEEM